LIVVRLVGAVLAYELALLASSLGLFFVGLTLVPAAAQGLFSLVALGLAEGLGLLAVLGVWRTVDGRPIRELGLQANGALWLWLRGAGVAGLMMVFIVLGWYTLLDGASWDLNPDSVRAGRVLVGGLLGFAIQGPAEEVLFRGYILDNVRARWGLTRALAVSSVGFGLLHAPNPAFGPLSFANLVLFGLAAGLYKVRVDNGRLWGVFGIHTAWNWLQQVVFGLPNSGLASVPDNALFTVSPNTSLPQVIWGGGFGPEGTLAASLVLLAVIGVAVRRPAPAGM